jgi:hypothetical protein
LLIAKILTTKAHSHEAEILKLWLADVAAFGRKPDNSICRKCGGLPTRRYAG